MRLALLIFLAIAIPLSAGFYYLTRDSQQTAGQQNEMLAKLPAPEGDPVLRVTGNIAVHNDGDAAVFDLALLDSLGTKSFETSSPWLDEVHRYEGVPLKRLLKKLGAEGRALTITALDNYSIRILPEDYRRFDPILATHIDGELIPVREKGPIWLMFAWDHFGKEIPQKEYQDKSIWQISTMIVE